MWYGLFPNWTCSIITLSYFERQYAGSRSQKSEDIN